MRRKLFSLTSIILLIGIVIAGCTTATPAPAPSATTAAPAKTMDIGILSPITGPAAFLGTSMQNAILLAIDDQNKEGGVTIAGQKYMLNGIVRDSKLDVAVSKSAAEELVFEKKVKIVTGTFLGDTIGAQAVTEPNKTMLIAFTCDLPKITGPDKPYSFFVSGGSVTNTINGAAYLQKFYPNLKKVLTLSPESPSAPSFKGAAELLFPRYGLESIGTESFPLDTKDFMPVITRALAKNAQVIDTAGTGGDMGGLCALLIKQLREAGYDGVIWARTLPPPNVMMEVVPAKYLNKIITNDIVVESPVVSDKYKAFFKRYMDKFKMPPIDASAEMYDGVKPFFEFLNGQKTMDSTAWMEGFAKYTWDSLWGIKGKWVGKPLNGIDRMLLWGFWVGEYENGKPVTKWAAPAPMDLFEAK